MNILIVDDSTLGIKIASEIATSLGHTIIATAKNGVEGIAQFKKYKPEVILTDIEMPEMDGITMASIILDHNTLVRIIIVSSVINKQITQNALAKGVSAVLKKPLDRTELSQAILGEYSNN